MKACAGHRVLVGCLALILLAGCASAPGTAVPAPTGPPATVSSAPPTTGSTAPPPTGRTPASTPPQTPTPTPESSPGSAAAPVPGGATTPGSQAPPATGGAAGALLPFFAAVSDIDARLQTAAAAVNAGIGEQEVTIDRSTVDLVEAAAPWPAADAVPAGLDPATEQAVLLVYSDLVSRYGSLNGDDCLQVGTVPRESLGPDCFLRGHDAKVRLPDDIDAAQAAAAASGITPADPDSAAAAEVRLRLMYINKANLGCGTTGGFRATAPLPVVWASEPSSDPALPPTDGTVGGIRFRAEYDPSAGWIVDLLAC
ncbi:hypothetical protein [Nakamurella sp.]|uniref:hypothetical protein n=1 Tax=Nakamurella sp. TaxID=1869182 RepID=UPI003B3A0816